MPPPKKRKKLNIRIPSGTDDVEIGSKRKSRKKLKTKSMKDLNEILKGVIYLVIGWVPFGMVTMVFGEPGVGKSAWVLFALVRPIICGNLRWFTELLGPDKPGFVLWCDTEGGNAITVQRIRDWNLPADKILVPFANDPLMPVSLDDDSHVRRMESLINQHKIKLVVIDSLRGSHDGDENNSKVGRVLKRLTGLAEQTGAAVVVVHHSRKLGSEEGISANASRGSNVILSLVRSQIGIDRPDPTSDVLRASMLKQNLGIAPDPVGFKITNTGVEFCDCPRSPRAPEKEIDRAKDFLREQLSTEEWTPAKQVQKANQDFSKNMLQRAREAIGIVKPKYVRKEGSEWQWKLPQQTKSNRQ